VNAFEKLLALAPEEKQAKGVECIPAEIAQQPGTWAKAVDILRADREGIKDFMTRSGLTGEVESTLILTGAGTSEFVGNSIVNVLRKRLRREVISVPTTHLVTHASSILVPGNDYTVLSFARSGNSPESIATYERIKQIAPQAGHMVITCNKDGALAKAAGRDDSAHCILLPEETNDRALAMTSSFSTMALSGIGLSFMDDLDGFASLSARLGDAANRVISSYGDMISDYADRPFTRACFLGSNSLFGAMQECHLKMQEMTEGKVACRFDSFLGLRHGPQVFVDDACVVPAALATDPLVRKYELDMLRELKAKGQGCGTLVICDRASREIQDVATDVVELFPNSDPVDDDFRVMTDVVVGQILATMKSLHLGLKPDTPSESGTIHRVVQGVVIYDA
jgi:tagatose-6-phosphate ketose/aldose isomerase